MTKNKHRGQCREYSSEQADMAVFEMDQSSLTEDWSLWPHIVMGGGINKFDVSSLVGSLETQMLLRHMLSRPFTIGAFGLLHQTAESLYIKPYALWLP